MILNLSPSHLIAAFTELLYTHDRRFVRFLIFLVVFVGSMILAPQVALGSRLFTLLLLLLIGIGPVLLLLYKPVIGLIVFIPASLYVPFSIGTGSATGLSAAVLLILLLAGLWILDMVVRQKSISFIPSRPLLPLAILLGVALLSFGMGQLPWFYYAKQAPMTAQIGGLAIFILSGATFSLAAHQIPNLRWLRILTWVFLGFATIHVFGRLLPSTRIAFLLQWGANGSPLWIWIVALALSQAVFNNSLKSHWRLFLGGLAAATLAVGWFQTRDWVSGWLPGMVVLGIIIWLYSWRVGIAASFIGLIMVLIFDPGLLNQLIVSDEYSINTRGLAWEIVLGEIVKINPLLGVGPANYYFYVPLFPILGWYTVFSSHNQYVDLLAQTGVIGLLCFLWFAWETWMLGWRLRKRVLTGFEKAYVVGAMAGLVAMLFSGMLGDWMIPFIYNVGLNGFRAAGLAWLFLGGLVVIERKYLEASG
jgi:hypothetical protein